MDENKGISFIFKKIQCGMVLCKNVNPSDGYTIVQKNCFKTVSIRWDDFLGLLVAFITIDSLFLFGIIAVKVGTE